MADLLVEKVSPHVIRGIRIRESGKFSLVEGVDFGLWNPEYRPSNPKSKYWKFGIRNPESTARNPESTTGLDSLEVVARFLGASKLGQAELIRLY